MKDSYFKFESRIIVEHNHKHSPPGDILPVFQTRGETNQYYNKVSKYYDFLADYSEAPVRRAGILQTNIRSKSFRKRWF